MLLTSVDWALRGATCALVLLIAASLLRDHSRLLAARLAALFAVGTGTYAITSVAGFSPQLGLWTIPLLALSAGNNVVFWAFTGALFDDSIGVVAATDGRCISQHFGFSGGNRA